MARPQTTTTFIDRFLATAEAYRVPAALVINKMDQLTDDERQEADYLGHIYGAIGYPVFMVSALTGDGLDAHGTGMHTTTFSELYTLPEGGALIDIPGIKGFGTFNMEREEVAHFFRDIFALSADCRFNNCTHTHEPGCAVLRALEDHRLAPSRYASYLSMLDDKDESKYREAF